jgi:hypothetical protein
MNHSFEQSLNRIFGENLPKALVEPFARTPKTIQSVFNINQLQVNEAGWQNKRKKRRKKT